jgi:molecular chaperone DnaJ
MHTPCNKCKGSGNFIKFPCGPCNGSGLAVGTVWETVQVPAGVSDGHVLKFQGKGHASDNKGAQGDLLVKILVGSHKFWKRKNYDLLSEVSISISQAALGCILQVDTLVGTSKLFIEPGCNSGDLKKLVGLGIPHLPPNNYKRGDHVFTVIIEIPRNLNEKQRKLLEQLALEDEAAGFEGNFNKFKTFYK